MPKIAKAVTNWIHSEVVKVTMTEIFFLPFDVGYYAHKDLNINMLY